MKHFRRTCRSRAERFGLFVCAVLVCAVVVRIASAEPDEELLGKSRGYPMGDAATMYAEPFKVGSFSATDKILVTRKVARGSVVTPLKKSNGVEITYHFQGRDYSLDDYLEHQRATALLILKGDQIVAERYRYGRGEQDRFLSFSMSKSVTSLLIGIALEKGILASLDDPAEKYVPELKGSGYGQATIRQLLRMSSGVKFVEKYDGKDDAAKLHRAQLGVIPEKPLSVLASFRERSTPAGTAFAYASSESTVLGYVLARAAGRNLETLTSQWLWQPLGAETDAAWNVNVDGQAQAEGRFNATLRDYGRLGLLLANDGRSGSEQIVPRAYLLEATDAAQHPDTFRPRVATSYFGYGYQFWLFPLRVRTFGLLGIYGQSIFIQPESKLVLVHLAVTQSPTDLPAAIEKDALWRGVLTTLGGNVEP